MVTEILDIKAREILDSRGNPTVEVDVVLDSGVIGRAAVPSGASTGSFEAVELRDQDPKRFGGKGVQKAIQSIEREIYPALVGWDALDQVGIDKTMIELDGTSQKSRLGANATLGVSMAVARAASEVLELPLYQYLGGRFARVMPVPMMNVINGGAHANNALDVQEFMIVPVRAESMFDAIRMGSEIFHTLRKLLIDDGFSAAVGDEGGFAPDFKHTHQALEYLAKAITKAGYHLGQDIALAVDVAATELYHDCRYVLPGEGVSLGADEWVDYWIKLSKTFPIVSIEDGMAEDDWSGWAALTESLGKNVQLVGDDLFVTQKQRLLQGVQQKTANAILIKLNQVGTVTETVDTIQTAQQASYGIVVSHRSGETEDHFIADLAVGMNAGQIKTGSLSRSDRLSKYNQLIRIEEELGDSAVYHGHTGVCDQHKLVA